MAIIEQISCDVCGKQKQDVNHWWMFDPPAADRQCVGFVVWHWDATKAQYFKHACGQECVIKAVNEYLSGGK